MFQEPHASSSQSPDRVQQMLEFLWFLLLLGTLVPSTYYALRAIMGLYR